MNLRKENGQMTINNAVELSDEALTKVIGGSDERRDRDHDRHHERDWHHHHRCWHHHIWPNFSHFHEHHCR